MTTERPDFIPESAEFSGICAIIDDIKRKLVFERGILVSLEEASGIGNHDAAIHQQRRVRAIEDMQRKAGEWARAVRKTREFSGFHINQEVVTPGGERGFIYKFEPVFEPTHIRVVMNSGIELVFVPDDLLEIG